MRADQAFGVVVRTFGLYLVIWGLWNLASLGIEVLALIAALYTDEALDLLTKLYYLVAGSGSLLLGFLLLARADAVVRWAYRHHEAAAAPVPPETTDRGPGG